MRVLVEHTVRMKYMQHWFIRSVYSEMKNILTDQREISCRIKKIFDSDL